MPAEECINRFSWSDPTRRSLVAAGRATGGGRTTEARSRPACCRLRHGASACPFATCSGRSPSGPHSARHPRARSARQRWAAAPASPSCYLHLAPPSWLPLSWREVSWAPHVHRASCALRTTELSRSRGADPRLGRARRRSAGAAAVYGGKLRTAPRELGCPAGPRHLRRLAEGHAARLDRSPSPPAPRWGPRRAHADDCRASRASSQRSPALALPRVPG